MKSTLKFHRTLRKFTNGVDRITVDVHSYYDLIIAAINMFPDLEKYFKNTFRRGLKEELILVKDNKIVDLEDMFLPAKKEVTLVPAIFGGGGNGGLIAGLAIIAIVAVSFFTGGLGALATSAVVPTSAGTIATGAAAGVAGATVTSLTLAGKLVLGIGLSLVLSSLAPKPEINNNTESTPDAGARAENNIFGSLANSTDSRSTVGLIYGLHRIGGQFVSGYVKTRDHGKEDVIQVGEEFA